MGQWLTEYGHWFSQMMTDGKYFDVLLSSGGIAMSILIVVLAVFLPAHRKKMILFVFAAWSYSALYHFTLEGKAAQAGGSVGDNISGLPGVGMFVVGFAAVTGVMLYFIFVRD